jgi:hypothetical protein
VFGLLYLGVMIGTWVIAMLAWRFLWALFTTHWPRLSLKSGSGLQIPETPGRRRAAWIAKADAVRRKLERKQPDSDLLALSLRAFRKHCLDALSDRAGVRAMTGPPAILVPAVWIWVAYENNWEKTSNALLASSFLFSGLLLWGFFRNERFGHLVERIRRKAHRPDGD